MFEKEKKSRLNLFCPWRQHKMYEVEPGGHRAMFVAKFYKHRVSTSAVLEDAKLSMVAETYAHDFNKRSGLDKTVPFPPLSNAIRIAPA